MCILFYSLITQFYFFLGTTVNGKRELVKEKKTKESVIKPYQVCLSLTHEGFSTVL